MRKILLAIVLVVASSAPLAQALEISQYQTVLASSEFTDLVTQMRKDGFEFRGLRDDGVKYRCPCYDFYASFLDTTNKTTKEIHVSLTGFGPQLKVTVSPQGE